MFKTPILMLKMTFFLLLFRGKFEQKTQKSISFKNQWRLKNIKKAMVVKNIIAEDMPFTKSIFEQFWRSYCKKTIFVVFHFLKFLPMSCSPIMSNIARCSCLMQTWLKQTAQEGSKLLHQCGGESNYPKLMLYCTDTRKYCGKDANLQVNVVLCLST